MRLEVKGKNVEVTPALRRYAESKLAKLQKQLSRSIKDDCSRDFSEFGILAH